jgi:hypothetical protein
MTNASITECAHGLLGAIQAVINNGADRSLITAQAVKVWDAAAHADDPIARLADDLADKAAFWAYFDTDLKKLVRAHGAYIMAERISAMP